MGDSKMASQHCVDGLQKYRKWREDEAFCDHEKKGVESQMKKRLQEGKTGFECLPYEILLDIFSRLLLMSILRARYTCQGWHRIMADPEFIETHINRASRSFGYLYRFSGDFAMYYVQKTVYGIEAIKTCDAFGHNYFLSGHASSGGLMACYAYKEPSYYICNPFIGDRVKVRRGCIYDCNLSWGFGYSPSTKEYKLVTFGTKRVHNETVIKGEIYTIGSESWRQIPHAPLPAIDKQVDCDGTLFWMIHTRFYEGGPETVMSFDVGTEKFRAWRVPPLEVAMHIPELKQSYIVKFDDTVAAYVVTNQPFCFNIWILRDKVNDIWINEYKIVVPDSPLRSLKLNFVGKWMNRLLFAGVDHKSKPKCASYDVDKEEFTIIQMPFWDYHEKRRDIHFQRIGNVSFISHAPSFVSPKSIMSINRAELAM